MMMMMMMMMAWPKGLQMEIFLRKN
uniref:Uncharacterized protein n=1 Tax=Arundo donax TaxID=35708 RepID=A0A0A9G188_ARUDO